MTTAVRTMVLIAALFGGSRSVSGQVLDTVRVTVHDHEMALYISRGAGPIVVMEAGGGSSHRAWNAVIPEISTFARVVAYDRPGYGLSDPCDSPRTADRIARELRQALDTARLDGPFTLVGWSYGGTIVRVFAGRFPDQTAGLVLVDPAPEDFYDRAAREYPDHWTEEEEAYFPALYADSTRRAEQREMAGYAPSMEQARASDARHATPTIVLIAGRDAEGPPDPISLVWIDELARWAEARPNTESRLVAGAGHHIARENPGAVTDAVRAILNAGPVLRER